MARAQEQHHTAHCEICGKAFPAARSSARYCGDACRQAASRARRGLVPKSRQEVAAEDVESIKERLLEIAVRESRDVPVTVVFSAGEYVKVLDRSQATGVSVEDYIRSAAKIAVTVTGPILFPPVVAQSLNTGTATSTVTVTRAKRELELPELSPEREMMRGTWDDPHMPLLVGEPKLADTKPVKGDDGWWHWVEDGEKYKSREKP